MIKKMNLIVFALLPLLTAVQAQAGTVIVNSTVDPGTGVCDETECTLREALIFAQGEGDLTIINFSDDLSGTITLASSLVVSAFFVEINGPGADVLAVSGDDQFRVFQLNGDEITLRGLTIRNGWLDSGSGAGVRVLGDDILLENLRIIDNAGTAPGTGGVGLAIGAGAVRNVEISGNNGGTASGMDINPSPGKHLLVENVTVSGNTSSNQVGAVRILTNADSTVTFRYVTVAGNMGAQAGTHVFGAADSVFFEASIFADHAGTREDLTFSPGVLTVNNSIVESHGSPLSGVNNLVADSGLAPLDFVEGSSLKVRPIAEGSAAFDHVLNGVGDPQCGTGVMSDQLGNPRPLGATCDAGAFEILPERLHSDGFELQSE